MSTRQRRSDPETIHQEAVLSALHLFGWRDTWRTNAGGIAFGTGKARHFIRLAPKGVSDIVGFTPDGGFCACEVKQPDGSRLCTPEQQGFLDRVRLTRRGWAMVCTSVDDVKLYLELYLLREPVGERALARRKVLLDWRAQHESRFEPGGAGRG